MQDDKRRDCRSEDFVSDVKQLEVSLLPILILPDSPLGLSQSCDHVLLKKTTLLTAHCRWRTQHNTARKYVWASNELSASLYMFTETLLSRLEFLRSCNDVTIEDSTASLPPNKIGVLHK